MKSYKKRLSFSEHYKSLAANGWRIVLEGWGFPYPEQRDFGFAFISLFIVPIAPFVWLLVTVQRDMTNQLFVTELLDN